MTAPDFLTVEDVELLHGEQLRLFGGLDGVRDRGALESAVAVPASSFGGEFLHVGLFAMAAAYAFHIAENQPFVDGNKRTALNGASGLQVVVFAGEPIGEPVVFGGPFAMTSRAELEDAFARYARGEMGQLEPSVPARR